MNLIRADKLLMNRGIAESRTAAAALIRTGAVSIDGKPIAKPATMVPGSGQVHLHENTPKWVSRGALKLDHALNVFGIDCSGSVALDSGASTGGFTECLLRRGAVKVYAVDVGYGQMHWSLRHDPRVKLLERTNLRTVPNEVFNEPIDLATLDLSFISLKLVLEKVRDLLATSGKIVALVKPQFEAGKDKVGRGGVIRDSEVHRQVLLDLAVWCAEHSLALLNVTASPITGPKGNREFLFYLKSGDADINVEYDGWIKRAVYHDE